ncbi:Uncharacterised protein [Mycobacteroides abscessus subsp. abscessus]|nr:Uncharacterised protein [Mycobacteroides abscessus subsp. abscessus]SHS26213.1 Uncharacterised protein [Mycobacteroides abscessus subsp. abscessus]SHS67632.1 Uncharacterised protein [Mycobacteroides abscessus subsp. abscessus]SKF22775.1 Uncharacterised protein [Mycobacteroides abscessus subsp. abscessus]SKG13839.1 Uncharacterised protein [Mycobacteroides abscessus subsp. abscessus]
MTVTGWNHAVAAARRFTCVAGYSISLKYGEREASAENRWESRNGFTLGAKGNGLVQVVAQHL